jgi:hypothetical protein
MTVQEKVCKRCSKTKPIKEFKRKLTLAQSRALLKRPTLRTPHELVSTLCKTCRPDKLTAKKIQNRVGDGEIHELVGQALKDKLKRQLKVKQSRSMKRLWQKKRDAVTTPWYLSIRQQVVKKYNYYSLQLSRNKHPALTQHAKLDYEIAREIKAGLLLKIKMGEGLKMDIYPRVNDYYTAEHKEQLILLWQQVPQEIRNNIRGSR